MMSNKASDEMFRYLERFAMAQQNLIRTNPLEAAKHFEQDIEKFDESGKILEHPNGELETTKEGISAWREASAHLKQRRPLKKLEWSDALGRSALEHCYKSCSKGLTEHKGADGSEPWDRINKYGKWGGSVAENLSFGDERGSEMIWSLYVDDGVPSRSHRNTMDHPMLKYVGMAICPHNSKYKQMLVIDYAEEITEN